MGAFTATIAIADPQRQRWEPLVALADTGSTYTWIPRDVLERLSVQPEFRWEFETADGRVIERDVAETAARMDGQQRTTLVVFGEPGSMPLLGAYTLEAFGLAADPVNRRLIRVRGLAMAAFS